MDYTDFEIRIGPRVGENRYAVSARSASGGAARGEFQVPLSDVELENLVLQLRLHRTPVRKVKSAEWQKARDFGLRLFRALLAQDVRESYDASLTAATNAGKGMRLKLTLDASAPELGDYPWEFLCDPANDQFLALMETTPLVRYVELRTPIVPLPVTPPLRMLAVVSSPTDYDALDVARERANLETALAELTRANLLALDWLEESRPDVLREQLMKKEYHIFHFIGHGGFDAQSSIGVLLFQDANGRSRAIGADRLAYILGNHRTLRLIVLNACEGARASRHDPFGSTAMTLLRTGNLPAVVAMQFEISDRAAIDFARGFYGALAAGRPMDAAVTQGRQAIYVQENDVEWCTPVLYLRATDGIIFNVDPQRAVAQTEKLELQIRSARAPEKTAAKVSAPPPTEPKPSGEPAALSGSAGTARTDNASALPQSVSEATRVRPIAPQPMIQSSLALYLTSIGVWAIAFVIPRFFGDLVFSGASFFIGVAAAAAGMYGLFRVSYFLPSRSAVIVMVLGYAAAILFVWFLAAFLTGTSKAITDLLLNPLLESQPDAVVYFMKDALSMALFGAVVGLLGGAVMLWQLQRATTS